MDIVKLRQVVAMVAEIPPEKFDLSVFYCFDAGCAIGWLAVTKQLGFYMKLGSPAHAASDNPFDAMAIVCEIDGGQVMSLFHQPGASRYDKPFAPPYEKRSKEIFLHRVKCFEQEHGVNLTGEVYESVRAGGDAQAEVSRQAEL